MRKVLIILGMAALTLPAAADIYADALREIASNSPELRVASREYDLSLAENATGLAPADPEVEFGYLWGGAATGDRKDVSVSQSFDFPTVYGKRSALSRSRDSQAEALLQQRRYDLMMRARGELVDLLYLNALYDYTARQLSFADSILSHEQRLYDRGQATRLDLNKAQLNRAELAAELQSVSADREEVRAGLAMLNGGKEVDFTVSEFPAAELPADFDIWWADNQARIPALKVADTEVSISQRDLSLAKSEWLPKLSLGYQGEFVRGSNFQGVTVGVSLPLWENRNRVRKARAALALAESSKEDTQLDNRLTMRALYDRAQSLIKSEAEFGAALTGSESAELLAKALRQGEVTVLQYVTEVQYLNTMTRRLLELARDRERSLIRFKL